MCRLDSCSYYVHIGRKPFTFLVREVLQHQGSAALESSAQNTHVYMFKWYGGQKWTTYVRNMVAMPHSVCKK